MKQELLDPRSLTPNPWNSNSVDPKNMAKLIKSIRDLGFTTSVIVREKEGKLEILGGQHRTEAAIELGLKKIPVLNLGVIDDIRAKKIGLIDNSKYGTDDSLKLAKVLDEIRAEDPDLTGFLPLQEEDLQVIMRAVEIDLDSLEITAEDDGEDPAGPAERMERPVKTHDILKFRVTVRNSESIRSLIERTIKKESLADADELTVAGDALSLILLGTP